LIPSIYEGFGLPAAEAARCGALVLSATGSALDEIVGSTKFSFNLNMDNEINRILELGLLSHESNIERQKMHKRSFKFSWDLSAKKLLEIYDTVL
jgi:mannosyltransferase